MNGPKPKDVRYVCLTSPTNTITHYADVGSMSACIFFFSIHTCVCSCFHIMDSGLVLSEKQLSFFFREEVGEISLEMATDKRSVKREAVKATSA